MSYYDYYKYLYPITYKDTITYKEKEISIEFLSINKVKENISRLIKFIKDLFTRVFNWIKNKINKVFKSSMVKLTIDRIKIIKKSKSYQILKNIDITDLVNSVITTKQINMESSKNDINKDLSSEIEKLLSTTPKLFISLVFDENNNFKNIDNLITFVDDVYNQCKDTNIDGYTGIVRYMINKYEQQLSSKPTYTYGSLTEYIDLLPQTINKAEKYYQDKYKELSIKLNDLNERLKNNNK